MTNDRICPEDLLRVLLPAEKIPDRSCVFKRTGEVGYVLRRDLTLYQYGKEAAAAVKITGYFLVGERGDITQIPPDAVLHWSTTADNLVDMLRESWEQENPQ